MGVGEVFERDHRAFAVVVPTEHPRQERRAARLRVEHVLVADPGGRVVTARAFHERAYAVRLIDEPMRRVGLAATRDLTPRDRARLQRAFDPSGLIGGRRVHDAGA